jgi:transcriptional regulator with XRE-family HTH domain
MSADISDILRAYTSVFCLQTSGRADVPGTGMANENLYQALESADLTAEDLAGLVRVDIRTVRRWLSGKPAYPRHRAKIARTLKLTEQALWPDIPASTETQPRDLLTGYPTADSIAIPSPETLIQTAQKRIELLDETLPTYFREGLAEILIQKAGQGIQVRVMVAEPGSQLIPLLEQPGIEIRVIEPGEHQAIHRYDDQMLVTLPLIGELQEPPPVIHIQRRGEGGLFDRFAAHYEDSWEHATEPLHSTADIEQYLSEDEAGLGSADAPEELDDYLATAPTITAPAESSPPARRWPRSPPER